MLVVFFMGGIVRSEVPRLPADGEKADEEDAYYPKLKHQHACVSAPRVAELFQDEIAAQLSFEDFAREHLCTVAQRRNIREHLHDKVGTIACVCQETCAKCEENDEEGVHLRAHNLILKEGSQHETKQAPREHQ